AARQIMLLIDNDFDLLPVTTRLGFVPSGLLLEWKLLVGRILLCARLATLPFESAGLRWCRKTLDSAFVRCTYRVAWGLKRGMFVSVAYESPIDPACLRDRRFRLHRAPLGGT